MNPQSVPNLKDIHLPDNIGWWPPTFGWWVMGLLLILILFVAIRLMIQYVQKRKPYRQAMKHYAQIESDFQQHQDLTRLLQQLSTLLRRAAINYFGRAQIAGFTGEHWLSFLDEHLPEQRFCQGEGRIFIEQPYQADVRDIDVNQVMQLVKDWLITARKDVI